MELFTKPKESKKLDAKRKKAIAEYIETQKQFKELYNMCVAQKFSLYYKQEELDIDALTEDQINKMDKASESEREALLKKYPKTMVDYEVYLVAPFYIGNAKIQRDSCIDELETETIELINERTKEEIKDTLYLLKD